MSSWGDSQIGQGVIGGNPEQDYYKQMAGLVQQDRMNKQIYDKFYADQKPPGFEIDPATGALRIGGMANGGPVDMSKGGPVPTAKKPGIDKVPAMLDAPPDGPAEFVIPGDAVAKLDALVQQAGYKGGLEAFVQQNHDYAATDARRAQEGAALPMPPQGQGDYCNGGKVMKMADGSTSPPWYGNPPKQAPQMPKPEPDAKRPPKQPVTEPDNNTLEGRRKANMAAMDGVLRLADGTQGDPLNPPDTMGSMARKAVDTAMQAVLPTSPRAVRPMAQEVGQTVVNAAAPVAADFMTGTPNSIRLGASETKQPNQSIAMPTDQKSTSSKAPGQYSEDYLPRAPVAAAPQARAPNVSGLERSIQQYQANQQREDAITKRNGRDDGSMVSWISGQNGGIDVAGKRVSPRDEQALRNLQTKVPYALKEFQGPEYDDTFRKHGMMTGSEYAARQNQGVRYGGSDPSKPFRTSQQGGVEVIGGPTVGAGAEQQAALNRENALQKSIIAGEAMQNAAALRKPPVQNRLQERDKLFADLSKDESLPKAAIEPLMGLLNSGMDGADIQMRKDKVLDTPVGEDKVPLRNLLNQPQKILPFRDKDGKTFLTMTPIEYFNYLLANGS